MLRFALNVGINKYNASYYGGNVDLQQCVFDATRLFDYANERGFLPILMTDKSATVANFKNKMAEYAKSLKKGDILLLSISGHGTYDDYIPPKSKATKRLTAHCFHDGILWDYEMREILKKFKAGVKVIKISDCCFAESNWRFIRDGKPYNNARARYTKIPKVEILPTPTQGDKRSIRCNYFDYASSNIYQVSYEDERGGVFTTAILEALKKQPELSYYQVCRRASELIAPNYPQSPMFENVRSDKLTGLKFLT